MGRHLFARVGGGDDSADGFLVESLEPAVTLQIFQMAADRAVANELITLLARDETGGGEPFGAFTAHGPVFAFGKGLAQKFKI